MDDDNLNSDYIYQDDNYNYNVNTYNLTTTLNPLTALDPSFILSATENDNMTSGMNPHKMERDWEINKQILQFPKIQKNQDFRMSELIKLDNYSFYFNFLHEFIKFIQPYDIPPGKNHYSLS